MQSLGYELLYVIPRESSIQKDVSVPAAWYSWHFGTDSDGRCTGVMRYFVDRFPDGYEGWAKARGEEPVARDYLKPF